jgi:hypothetical protein
MPEPIVVSAESEAVLSALHNYISDVHQEWKTLIELFGSGDQRAKLLHHTANGFFDTVYQALLRDVLLGIARLCDPLKTAGQDNLVLERLLQLPEILGAPELLDNLTRQFAEIKAQAKPFREYRHKYLAHLDLLTSVQAVDDGAGFKREDVGSVLAAIAKLFNMVSVWILPVVLPTLASAGDAADTAPRECQPRTAWTRGFLPPIGHR